MRQLKPVNTDVCRLWRVIVLLGVVSLTAICGCVHPSSPAYDPHPVPLPARASPEPVEGEKAVREQQVQVKGTAGSNPPENRSPVQASEDITTGVTLFEGGQFVAAQQFFAEFVSRHPTDPAGAYYLGRLAFESKQYDQAATSFEQAVQLDSDNAEYHRWLGRTYGRQAERQGGRAFFLARKVKTHLEKAIELNPDSIEARFDLMEYYLLAPPLLGGGLDKARVQAEEIAKRNAAAGRKAWQRCQTGRRLNPREKDYSAQETCQKRSVAAGGRMETEKGSLRESSSSTSPWITACSKGRCKDYGFGCGTATLTSITRVGRATTCASL